MRYCSDFVFSYDQIELHAQMLKIKGCHNPSESHNWNMIGYLSTIHSKNSQTL